jgi:hypothetical protein
MSNRVHQVAAALALSALTTAQAFALTTSQIAFAPQQPQLKITSCFTRYFFNSTSSATSARACDAGEKPGTVKVVYVG